MNNDLISRNELLEELRFKRVAVYGCGSMKDIDKVIESVKTAPAVDAVSLGVYEQVKWERDVAIKLLEALGIDFGQKKPDMEPVRHGYWIPQDNTHTKFMCSDCKGRNHDGSGKRCSECGCKMDAPDRTTRGGCV